MKKPEVPIDHFKQVRDKFLSQFATKEDPVFNIGDRVKTLPDQPNSYISKVIGTGKEGIIKTVDYIPLVDFGKEGEYYVYQKKLKSC